MSWNNDERNVRKIVSFIKERVGILVHPHQTEAISHYLKRCAENYSYTSFQDFFEDLRSKNENSFLYNELISIITVCESYFFRDEEQMLCIKNFLLPEIINSKSKSGYKSIRVWSAGCAAGQEIYSIAILINELISDPQNWRLQLYGTDINAKALNQARAGVYSSWALREVSEHTIRKYFNIVRDEYYLTNKIKSMVRFSYHNLLDENNFSSELESTNFDLILCRNVILYFNPDIIESIINRLSHCLAKDGVLFLSPVDRSKYAVTSLKKEEKNKVVYFVNTKAEDVVKKELLSEKEPFIVSSETNNQEKSSKKVEINKHLSDPLHEAMLCASRGDFDMAHHICNEFAGKDKLNFLVYFVNALILKQENFSQDAEINFKKSIFLNNKFIDAHYCLGVLLIQQNKVEKGLKEFLTTLELLKHIDMKKNVYFNPQLHYGDLLKLVKKQITICKNSLGSSL